MDFETFDYGLEPGETFEPLEDDEIDRSQPYILTALGPIDPGALGPANLAASFVPRAAGDDLGQILIEIQECAAVGMNALVDLRPIATRQEADAALWLAERCDIHLIVAAGIDPDAGTAGNVSRLIEQASLGLHGTRLLPGLIVTLPDLQSISIARASHEATGLPMVVDARAATPAGVPEHEPIAIATTLAGAIRLDGHERLLVDLHRDDFNLLDNDPLSLLRQNRAMLVGFDPPAKEAQRFSRWSWLIEEFPIQLLEFGLTPDDVRTLLIDNPADYLTITLPAPARC